MKSRLLISILQKFYPLILVLVVGVYGYWRIHTLENNLERSDNQLRQVTSQYEVLVERYENLGDRFEKFSRDVQEDLAEQREVRSRISNMEREYQEEFNALRETFERDARGNRRDMDAIIDARPSHLEMIINNATRGIRDEFENIDR